MAVDVCDVADCWIPPTGTRVLEDVRSLKNVDDSVDPRGGMRCSVDGSLKPAFIGLGNDVNVEKRKEGPHSVNPNIKF